MLESVTTEIEEIRARLAKIDEQRDGLTDGSSEERDQLLAEEHRLLNRLSELEDVVAREESGTAEKKAAAQTDINRTPDLPDSDRE